MEISRERLDDLVSGVRTAYVKLEGTLSDLTDSAVGEPSLLPGWTRGHVLTHLARNADSHVRLLEAAADGQLVEQYAGGAEGRAADIEAGAGRDAARLVEDVSASHQRLTDLWAALPDEAWDRSVNSNRGMRPAWRLVWSRWRELDIHHVDVDLGYRPSDWSDDFTVMMFHDLADGLEARLPADAMVEIAATDQPLRWSGMEGTPSTRMTVRGPASSIVAWLVGRDAAAEGIEVRDENGRPVGLPTLGRWA